VWRAGQRLSVVGCDAAPASASALPSAGADSRRDGRKRGPSVVMAKEERERRTLACAGAPGADEAGADRAVCGASRGGQFGGPGVAGCVFEAS